MITVFKILINIKSSCTDRTSKISFFSVNPVNLVKLNTGYLSFLAEVAGNLNLRYQRTLLNDTVFPDGWPIQF